MATCGLSAPPPNATSCGGVGARRWWTKRWASPGVSCPSWRSTWVAEHPQAKRRRTAQLWIVGMSLQFFPLLVIQDLCPRRLGLLPVRSSLRHRSEYRSAHVPNRQSSVLRKRPPGQPLRMAKPGQRARNGIGAGVRRVPVGHHWNLRGAVAHVPWVQHNGPRPSLAAAVAPRQTDPRLGAPLTRQPQSRWLAQAATRRQPHSRGSSGGPLTFLERFQSENRHITGQLSNIAAAIATMRPAHPRIGQVHLEAPALVVRQNRTWSG